jgi:hypothetical protein
MTTLGRVAVASATRAPSGLPVLAAGRLGLAVVVGFASDVIDTMSTAAHAAMAAANHGRGKFLELPAMTTLLVFESRRTGGSSARSRR